MNAYKLLLVLISNVLYLANCYKILIVSPLVSRSHYALTNTLAMGLAEAGHDVTMLSPFEHENPPKNGSYRDIVLTDLEEKKNDFVPFFNLDTLSPLQTLLLTFTFANQHTKKILEHPNFQKLIHSNESFDAIILEKAANDAMVALGYHFKAPLIQFYVFTVNAAVNRLVANPSPPSYIPDIFLDYTSNMTFWQRVVNSVSSVVFEILRYIVAHPLQNELMKKHFPDAPDLDILNYNASLILVNSHESISQAIPLVPNMIQIGGFHIKPTKLLPNDLQKILDDAVEGVVYFSLGTNILASQMPENIKEIIFKALGSLKQTVLCKWDEDEVQGLPKNIKISKWFPQQDVLAHPNVKLFITHCGLFSTLETIHHGVPILGLPIFGDQRMNAHRSEAVGIGISLPFFEITEKKFNEALHQILFDKRYLNNVKSRSAYLRDRPIKPLDLAIYWVEFVCRHKGAPHLRVAGLNLPWYKSYLLDVIAFLVIIASAAIIFIYFVCRMMCSVCKKSKKVKTN